MECHTKLARHVHGVHRVKGGVMTNYAVSQIMCIESEWVLITWSRSHKVFKSQPGLKSEPDSLSKVLYVSD